MTRDRDAFVFYSAVVIAVASLFIGHDVAPEAAAPVAQAGAQLRSATLPVPATAEQRPLVIAVSHQIR